MIYAVANQLVDVYASLLDWSRTVREAEVPRRTRRLYEIVSHLADQPQADIRTFVDQLAASLNDALRQAADGRTDPLILRFVCTITADERLLEQFTRELKRIR